MSLANQSACASAVSALTSEKPLRSLLIANKPRQQFTLGYSMFVRTTYTEDHPAVTAPPSPPAAAPRSAVRPADRCPACRPLPPCRLTADPYRDAPVFLLAKDLTDISRTLYVVTFWRSVQVHQRESLQCIFTDRAIKKQDQSERSRENAPSRHCVWAVWFSSPWLDSSTPCWRNSWRAPGWTCQAWDTTAPACFRCFTRFPGLTSGQTCPALRLRRRCHGRGRPRSARPQLSMPATRRRAHRGPPSRAGTR